jgi:hypothetical protein
MLSFPLQRGPATQAKYVQSYIGVMQLDVELCSITYLSANYSANCMRGGERQACMRWHIFPISCCNFIQKSDVIGRQINMQIDVIKTLHGNQETELHRNTNYQCL